MERQSLTEEKTKKSKRNSKLVLIITVSILGVAILLSVGALCLINNSQRNARKTAEYLLYHTVPNPQHIKINSISDVDSVIDNQFIKTEEKMGLGIMMMKNSDIIMGSSPTDYEQGSFQMELMDRQTLAMSALRDLFDLDYEMDGDEVKEKKGDNKLTGWRVKIDYNGVSAKGNPYRSEFWFILDPTGKHVLKSFEIPIIADNYKQ